MFNKKIIISLCSIFGLTTATSYAEESINGADFTKNSLDKIKKMDTSNFKSYECRKEVPIGKIKFKEIIGVNKGFTLSVVLDGKTLFEHKIKEACGGTFGIENEIQSPNNKNKELCDKYDPPSKINSEYENTYPFGCQKFKIVEINQPHYQANYVLHWTFAGTDNDNNKKFRIKSDPSKNSCPKIENFDKLEDAKKEEYYKKNFKMIVDSAIKAINASEKISISGFSETDKLYEYDLLTYSDNSCTEEEKYRMKKQNELKEMFYNNEYGGQNSFQELKDKKNSNLAGVLVKVKEKDNNAIGKIYNSAYSNQNSMKQDINSTLKNEAGFHCQVPTCSIRYEKRNSAEKFNQDPKNNRIVSYYETKTCVRKTSLQHTDEETQKKKTFKEKYEDHLKSFECPKDLKNDPGISKFEIVQQKQYLGRKSEENRKALDGKFDCVCENEIDDMESIKKTVTQMKIAETVRNSLCGKPSEKEGEEVVDAHGEIKDETKGIPDKSVVKNNNLEDNYENNIMRDAQNQIKNNTSSNMNEIKNTTINDISVKEAEKFRDAPSLFDNSNK